MLSYTNTLLHHLVEAGKCIYTRTNKDFRDLNLITFHVSDLMRSKLQCSENGFITLLRVMYMLEKDSSMKDKFKIIRIKNKLDQPANNIIVNYLFLGKVQC